MARIYESLLKKRVQAALKDNVQRDGILVAESDRTIKILSLNKLSVIQKMHVIALDTESSGIIAASSQQTELQKIKDYLGAVNKEAISRLTRRRQHPVSG
jgi:hypothetical protein